MTPPAAPDAPPGPDFALPAVNHAGGIARLMGDSVLFARVLARFRSEYRHAAIGICIALDAGDLPLAQRLAHTLKGAAAMIEAVPLRQAAQALEQDLRSAVGATSSQACVVQLARLDAELERVLQELDSVAGALPDTRPQQPAQHQASRQPQEQALQRLRVLLEDGNGDAVDLVHDAAGSLMAELGEERYRQLAAAIDVFDFDGALALLA